MEKLESYYIYIRRNLTNDIVVVTNLNSRVYNALQNISNARQYAESLKKRFMDKLSMDVEIKEQL